MAELGDTPPYYNLSLRFRHPSIDPIEITTLLDIEPDHAWKIDEQGKTSTGTLLNFTRKESYWSYSTYTDDRFFFKEVDEIIDYLLPHREFLHRLVTEGGSIEIYIKLPGMMNIGDTIPLKTLAKLVDMKIELSIEVFPHMRRQ